MRTQQCGAHLFLEPWAMIARGHTRSIYTCLWGYMVREHFTIPCKNTLRPAKLLKRDQGSSDRPQNVQREPAIIVRGHSIPAEGQGQRQGQGKASEDRPMESKEVITKVRLSGRGVIPILGCGTPKADGSGNGIEHLEILNLILLPCLHCITITLDEIVELSWY